MKRRLTPQEKKKLAYEKDHYVSGGESRHAFRKNWPKKKAVLNQKHRHRAAQKLSVLAKLGDIDSIKDSRVEITAEELKKVHPREKLFKFGVKSLREFVDRNAEERESHAGQRLKTRKLIAARCKQLIATLETNPSSRTAQAFVRDLATTGSWGSDFWIFLRWHPEFRSKLEKAWLAATKAAEKAEMKRLKKEAEKQHTKVLLKAIRTEATARSHIK